MEFSAHMIVRLTRDPEMRYTPSGTAVTNLSVVTSEKISKEKTPQCPDGWKDGYGGKTWELTTFMKVTVWGSQAEACNEYLRKGSLVYIEATLAGEAKDGVRNPRIWTGNDGQPRCSYEFTAKRVVFLTRPDQSEKGQIESSGQSAPEQEPGEIPF